MKQSTEDANVMRVPNINSRRLVENKLPNVLKAKKTANIQMSISIILFFFPLLSSLYLTDNTAIINKLSSIENASNDFISSTEFSLPAHTLS
jgi:hypothetical protein